MPSFGPTLPLSNPLNFFEGIKSRSDNFTSSSVTELALAKEIENLMDTELYGDEQGLVGYWKTYYISGKPKIRCD